MGYVFGWILFALMAIFCCTIWTLNNYEYKNHKKCYPKKYFFLCLLLLYGCYRGYLADKHDSDLRERKTEALKASEVFSWVEYKNHKKRYPKKYFFLCLLLLYGCYRGYLLDKHDSDLRERKTEALKASEVFSWVEYNPRDEILIVQFEESDHRYKYLYFPEELYEDFVYSDSLGKFCNRYIKGQYPSVIID